jgi:putative drug exporter of the RND superfamily
MMLAVIYLLLVVVFRSLLLPLKAIALSLLSVAATIGVVVLVFQHGFLAGVLGVQYVGPVQNFVPVLLISIQIRFVARIGECATRKVSEGGLEPPRPLIGH